jgi:hypothetical protein
VSWAPFRFECEVANQSPGNAAVVRIAILFTRRTTEGEKRCRAASSTAAGRSCFCRDNPPPAGDTLAALRRDDMNPPLCMWAATRRNHIERIIFVKRIQKQSADVLCTMSYAHNSSGPGANGSKVLGSYLRVEMRQRRDYWRITHRRMFLISCFVTFACPGGRRVAPQDLDEHAISESVSNVSI